MARCKTPEVLPSSASQVWQNPLTAEATHILTAMQRIAGAHAPACTRIVPAMRCISVICVCWDRGFNDEDPFPSPFYPIEWPISATIFGQARCRRAMPSIEGCLA